MARSKIAMYYVDVNTRGFPLGCGERYDRSTRWRGVLQQKLGDDDDEI